MGLFKFFKRSKKNVLEYILKPFYSSSDVVAGSDSTTFAAMDLICSTFASLPGFFYDRATRQAVKEHHLYEVIRNPNSDETRYLFFYCCAKDYFNGNVYLYKYEREDELVSLFRLNPASVMIRRDTITNQKLFSYGGQEYTSDTILHIPSRWSYDGLKGHSIVDECRRIFNNAAELDDYINNSFNNSIGNRLVIDITKRYPNANQEQVDELKRIFIQNYSGVRNAGVPLIKHGNMEYSAIQTDLKDNRANQLVENRTFQEREIAKLFGVPLALLNGNKTGDLEAIYTFFIENAIRPLATSFEQAINQLIPHQDREYIYFEYSYNGLLKTSIQAKIDAYTKQITNGILSVNEVRRMENLPGVEAGDYHFIPANLMPLREDVITAYMAKAKETQLNIDDDHPTQGDDKGM
jgi:HK97 family phage portal protein